MFLFRVQLLFILITLSSCACLSSMCRSGQDNYMDAPLRGSFSFDSWVEEAGNKYAVGSGVNLSNYASPRIYRSEDRAGWYLFYKENTPSSSSRSQGQFDSTGYLVLFVDEASGRVYQ